MKYHDSKNMQNYKSSQKDNIKEDNFFDKNTHKKQNKLINKRISETDKSKVKNSKKIEEGVEDENVLKINENYAKKFDEIKRREAIEKAKLKYGENYFFKNSDEDSEQESEDSEAELVNDRVLEKFVETIVKLQDDDKVKELVQTDKPIFEEEDFAETNNERSKKKEKAFTVKDALLKFDAESENDDNDHFKQKEENDIFSVNYKEKNLKKIDKEKEEFMKVAAEAEKENEDQNDFLDDGFLKVKKSNKDEEKYLQDYDNKKVNSMKKNKHISENNLEENQNEVPVEVSNLKLDEILKKRKNVKNLEVLKKFWGEGQNLDSNEKFLRNYILSEAWLNNNEDFMNRKMYMIDKEDEEKDQVFEEFEERYNFRYEEEGGANITTHRRDMESYRIKDDSKKIKRKEREQKKEEEKGKIISDLHIAKEAKKSELKSKLEILQKIAGTDKIKVLADELEKEFDSNNFDKIMNKIYNEEYYQTFDKEEDIKDAIEEKMFDYKTNKSIPNKEKILELERLENEGFVEENSKVRENEVEIENKKEKKNKKQLDKVDENNLNDESKGYYNNEEQEIYEEENEGENEWFYCDNCFNIIKENKIKYECETCDDYCLCKACFSSKNHHHQMKKSKVPLGCKVRRLII